MSPKPGREASFDPSDQRLFVWIYFKKSTRYHLSTISPRRIDFTMIPIIHTPFHTVSIAGANLRENWNRAKGKPLLNRGSNQALSPHFPFLVPVQLAGISLKNLRFPFTPNCLNIIEPRFEPPSSRGRLLGLYELGIFPHFNFILFSLYTENWKLITDDQSLFTIHHSLFYRPSTSVIV